MSGLEAVKSKTMSKVPMLELKEISDQTGEKNRIDNKSALEQTVSKGTSGTKVK